MQVDTTVDKVGVITDEMGGIVEQMGEMVQTCSPAFAVNDAFRRQLDRIRQRGDSGKSDSGKSDSGKSDSGKGAQ